MSVVIEGIRLPDYGKIMVELQAGGNARYVDAYGELRYGKATTIPPHRDLIDRDALTTKSKIVLTGIGSTSFTTEAVLMADIKNAPTIYTEEVYDKYTDTAGNLHWTGTHRGKHIVKAEEGET